MGLKGLRCYEQKAVNAKGPFQHCLPSLTNITIISLSAGPYDPYNHLLYSGAIRKINVFSLALPRASLQTPQWLFQR